MGSALNSAPLDLYWSDWKRVLLVIKSFRF